MGVQAAGAELKDITLTPENQAESKEMVKVCFTCHSEDKAHRYLESADAHKLAGDALVIEGAWRPGRSVQGQADSTEPRAGVGRTPARPALHGD